MAGLCEVHWKLKAGTSNSFLGSAAFSDPVLRKLAVALHAILYLSYTDTSRRQTPLQKCTSSSVAPWQQHAAQGG